jgi:hypothetical protein
VLGGNRSINTVRALVVFQSWMHTSKTWLVRRDPLLGFT